MDNLRTANIKIGGARFNISSDDRYLAQLRPGVMNAIVTSLRRVGGLDSFEPRMAKLFSTLVQPTDICLDVGANIGCTAILLAQLAQLVISFEPTPRTFSLLTLNVERSGLNNVRCHRYALGSAEGKATINYSKDDRSGAFVGELGQGVGETDEILVRRLDDAYPEMQIERVDFIKLDVEGFEGKVIEGGWDVISRHRPTIQMELNSWCLNALQRIALPDFLDFLLDRFPIVYGIEKDQFVDIRQPSGRWLVMHKNIIERRFKELVVAFDPSRLRTFHAKYSQIK